MVVDLENSTESVTVTDDDDPRELTLSCALESAGSNRRARSQMLN
jgi:hypothetical protein